MKTILHLSHAWGGGLGKWVEDFAKGSPPGVKNIVLAGRFRNGRYADDYTLINGLTGDLLGEFILESPISEMDIENNGYFALLENIVDSFGVTDIFVSTLIGHSFEVFKIERNITFISHDYFPYCPGIFLRYETQCRSCTKDRLQQCLANNDLSHRFRGRTASFWVDVRELLIKVLSSDRVKWVLPSVSVNKNLSVIDSRFGDISHRIVPHGIPQKKENLFGGANEWRRLRVLLPGRFDGAKGKSIIQNLVSRFHTRFDFYALGCHAGVDFYSSYPDVKYWAEYENKDLRNHMAEIQPDVVLLTSVVPESFSFTLSEMINYCIPIIATDLGSFAHRVDDRMGIKVSPLADEFAKALLKVDGNRGLLIEYNRFLQSVSTPTLEEMFSEYMQR